MATILTIQTSRTVINVNGKRLFLLHAPLTQIFNETEGDVFAKRAAVRKDIRIKLINTFGEETYSGFFRECEWDEVNNKPLFIVISN